MITKKPPEVKLYRDTEGSQIAHLDDSINLGMKWVDSVVPLR
jgi:hypothetical protein